jgi:hypothetical protein
MSQPTVAVKIKAPRVPSYVFLEGLDGNAKIGIEHLTEEQLRAVGTAWTDALIAHAIHRRRPEP